MGIFTNILSSVGGDLIKSLDGLFTSDEERLQVEAKIRKVLLDAEAKAKDQEIQMEQELTKRLQADMKSDSWLAKNVRPASLVFLLIVVTILAVFDGNLSWNEHSFDVGAQYISLYENLLLTTFVFYFGSRGLEKRESIKLKRVQEENKQNKTEEEIND